MPTKTLAALARTAPAWLPEVDPDPPPTQTKPQRQEGDGWLTRIKQRIKLAMEGDDEELEVANDTAVSWHVYHSYHLLGILDPWETCTFRLRKSGNINVRPRQDSDASEYLVVDLNGRIQRVEIYRRRMGQELDIYDMRAA
ncbi:MAG TPA: hypothetical protein VF458_03080 [Ktedonobacteraceae bacterium]